VWWRCSRPIGQDALRRRRDRKDFLRVSVVEWGPIGPLRGSGASSLWSGWGIFYIFLGRTVSRTIPHGIHAENGARRAELLNDTGRPRRGPESTKAPVVLGRKQSRADEARQDVGEGRAQEKDESRTNHPPPGGPPDPPRFTAIPPFRPTRRNITRPATSLSRQAAPLTDA